MGLRTRRMGKAGYREVVPEVEDMSWGKGYHFAILGFWIFFHDIIILILSLVAIAQLVLKIQ